MSASIKLLIALPLFTSILFQLSQAQGTSRNGTDLDFRRFAWHIMDLINRFWVWTNIHGVQRKNPMDLVEPEGYEIDTHVVETGDGYFLELHRMYAKGRDYGQNEDKYPVLLMHGILQSSADWVINIPTNQSLAYLLVNKGYDLWLGNFRGNTYSDRHQKHEVESSQFWDFSFHEMGKYDVPAMIDRVLQITKKPKLHYVAFSMGTSAFITGMSLQPKYNKKVASATLFAPVAFMNNFWSGQLDTVSWILTFVDKLIREYGSSPSHPHTLARALHGFLPKFCHPVNDEDGICLGVIHAFFGDDGGILKKELMPLLTSVTPTPIGVKALNHFRQVISWKQFAQYDYGFAENLQRYGSPIPPSYDLKNVKVPTALYAGLNDRYGNYKDVRELAKVLPNLIEHYEVPDKMFSHLCFTYGGPLAADIYERAINLLSLYD